MTTTAPVPQPAPSTHWPAVFNGIGALVVRCDLDPAALVEKINAKSGQGALTWIAPKLTGTDITPRADIEHAISVWRSLGLHVGGWIYNEEPTADVASIERWRPLDLVVYDVEQPYKSDEGGHREYAAELVAEHALHLADIPAAVTSYGGYKTSIDFAAFAAAGWPILAQVYDAYIPGDERTYYTRPLDPPSLGTRPGVYPPRGVHRLTRSLKLAPGEAVYRPESIDG